MARQKKRPPDGIFVRNIDRRYRKNLEAFLKGHPRYKTMTTWNENTSYANDVKLANLYVPGDKMELATQLAMNQVECPDWDDLVIRTRQEFYEDTGWSFGFNGKHCGHMVLYLCKADPDDASKYTVLINQPVDQDADFASWGMKELRDRVDVVQKFDAVCENLRDAFIGILLGYELVQRTVDKKRTVQVLSAPAPKA